MEINTTFARYAPKNQWLSKQESFTRFIGYTGILGVDVETVSLDDKTLLGASFAISPDESYWFNIHSDLFPWHILEDPTRVKIFHNCGFDIGALEAHRPGLKVLNYHDSCLAAQVVGLPGKLALLCLELFGRPVRNIKELLTSKDMTMADVPEEKVAERCCIDARDCLEAWYHIEGMAGVPREALELEEGFLPYAMGIEGRGMRIDKEAIRKHRATLERRHSFLKTYCQTEWGFNPGSSQQFAAFLDTLGIKYPN